MTNTHTAVLCKCISEKERRCQQQIDRTWKLLLWRQLVSRVTATRGQQRCAVHFFFQCGTEGEPKNGGKQEKGWGGFGGWFNGWLKKAGGFFKRRPAGKRWGYVKKKKKKLVMAVSSPPKKWRKPETSKWVSFHPKKFTSPWKFIKLTFPIQFCTDILAQDCKVKKKQNWPNQSKFKESK